MRSIFFVLYLSAYLFSLTAELERTQALLWPAFARADFPLARDILGRTALLMGEVVVLRTAEHLLESAVSLFFLLGASVAHVRGVAVCFGGSSGPARSHSGIATAAAEGGQRRR